MNWYLYFVLCAAFLAAYIAFVFLAPTPVVHLVLYAIAGWQVGIWIGRGSAYLLGVRHAR